MHYRTFATSQPVKIKRAIHVLCQDLCTLHGLYFLLVNCNCSHNISFYSTLFVPDPTLELTLFVVLEGDSRGKNCSETILKLAYIFPAKHVKPEDFM